MDVGRISFCRYLATRIRTPGADVPIGLFHSGKCNMKDKRKDR